MESETEIWKSQLWDLRGAYLSKPTINEKIKRDYNGVYVQNGSRRERESLRSGFIVPFFFLGGGFVCLHCLVGGVFFASAPTVYTWNTRSEI